MSEYGLRVFERCLECALAYTEFKDAFYDRMADDLWWELCNVKECRA